MIRSEWINAYMFLSTGQDTLVAETTCIAQEQNDTLSLSYSLFDSDCLFDFANKANKIELQINKEFFTKYQERFELITEKQVVCCNTQSKLYELVNCKLVGMARKMYLESTVLYLLYQIQKNNLLFQLQCDSCELPLNQVEAEKINLAKEYIANNLGQNITIPILAAQVGTNQCYLKKSFKDITGQTIFEFIQQNRMIKAKHILRNSSTSIQEIASIVGYASTSSFSQTYKNYFGITPSMEQKQFIPNS